MKNKDRIQWRVCAVFPAVEKYMTFCDSIRIQKPLDPLKHPLKYDEGKYDPTLVEPWVVKALSKVYQEGIDKKYSRGSWKLFDIDKARELVAPAIRHLDAYRGGEFIDPDGGNPHLMKAIWNLLTVYYHEERVRNETSREA